jgi:hypothetical protein
MGHAIVSVGGLPRVLETEFALKPSSSALSRDGFAANYLGLTGWQDVECWLRPGESWYDGEILKFGVAADLASHLEHRPYRLTVRGRGLAEIATVNFVWPSALEPDLPTRVTPGRRAVGDPLPTRTVPAGARPVRLTRAVATDVDAEPTRRAPGRRVPLIGGGKGGWEADGEAAPVEIPPDPEPAREPSPPAVPRSEPDGEIARPDRVGATDEQRHWKSGTVWIGLAILVGLAVAATAATGWWWRTHPPVRISPATEPASRETPPDVRDSLWLKPAPEPVPAPEPTPAPEPVPAPEPTPAPEPVPAPASRPAAPTHAGIAK